MCKIHEFPNLFEFKNAQFESAEIKHSHSDFFVKSRIEFSVS